MEKLSKLTKKYKNSPVQFKASLWYLVCSVIQKGISVITTPIFTRLMSTYDYGKFNVFISWMNVLMVFFTLDIFWEVFEQGLVKFSERIDRFASSMQGLVLTLVCIWGIVYSAFYKFWNNLFLLSTVQMVLMFILIWTTAVFDFWAAEQRVKYKYKSLVALTLVLSVLSPIVGIILVLFCKDKVTARIFALAITQFFCYIGLFILQMKRGKTFFDKFFWRYALSLSIPLIPHYLSQTILGSSDRIMIEKIVGASQAGIYSLAYSISLVMSIFNQALNATLGPWIFQKIKYKRTEDLSHVIYPAFIGIACVNLVLMAFAPELVHIFAPKEYYEAIWIIPPIVMSVYFTFSYDIFCKFEFYYEKTRAIAAVTMIGAVLNILLNYYFINLTGYQAAAYTTLFCYFLYGFCHYCLMHRICRIELNGNQPFSIRILSVITICFLSIGFLFLISYSNMILRYGIILAFAIVLFAFRKKIRSFINTLGSMRSSV